MEVAFSPSKVSEIEYEILKTFTESEFALTTSEVYVRTIERMCRKKGMSKELSSAIVKEKLSEFDKAKKKGVNLRESAEVIATFMRKYYDIPTYPRVVRILESLESVGWVDGRRPSKEKSAILWAIDDDVRKKMQP